MLDDKLREATRDTSDADVKRDIMSILVRAKQAAQERSTEDYALNAQAMIDQVVCLLHFLGLEPLLILSDRDSLPFLLLDTNLQQLV
jgi:hypothetical protein